MAVTNLPLCEFVVWTPQGLFVENIPFDTSFWSSQADKCLTFFHDVILPELVTKYFTNLEKNKIPHQSNVAMDHSYCKQ